MVGAGFVVAKNDGKPFLNSIETTKAEAGGMEPKPTPQESFDRIKLFHAEVRKLKSEFREDYYSDLERLYGALGRKDIDKWARKVYEDKRKDKEYAIELNRLRRRCLKLLYKLVDKWEEYDYSPAFEEAMLNAFPRSKIVEILRICLPMDRAHALYALYNADTDKYGYHWYSKLHFEDGSKFLQKYGSDKEVRRVQKAILENEKQQPKQKPPMNKKLYRLLLSEKLGLQDIPEFRRWLQPELAKFVDRYDPNDIPENPETVFLSHTGADRLTMIFAARMKEEFEKGGVTPFFDETSIKPGVLWRSTIDDRVKDCPIFICFLSPNYFFRHWCMHELDLAIQHDKYIIPVYVECGPPEVDEEFFHLFVEKHKRDQPYKYGKTELPSEALLTRWSQNISQLSDCIQGITDTGGKKQGQNEMKDRLLQAVKDAKKDLGLD